jgi:nitrile hydratase
MDGMHDLGGKQGFGRVRFKKNAPVFHHAWHARSNALFALGVRCGIFNMDEYRHAIERMEPRHYLTADYYERSLTGVATLCVEKGVVTRAELEKRAGGAFPLSAPLGQGRTNAPARARFQPGDRVRVKDDYVPGHVRMPAYIRGKAGVVVSESAPFPYPDAEAHGVAAVDEPTYDVCFRTEELWPGDTDAAELVAAVFQSYLERA